jgi:hypothetical protein
MKETIKKLIAAEGGKFSTKLGINLPEILVRYLKGEGLFFLKRGK